MKTIQDKLTERDGKHLSPWQSEHVAANGITTADPEKIYDCIIVGAGLTGITTAIMLQKAGKDVLVVDAHNPAYGTTGGTTAHINTFADTTYTEAENAFGKDGAREFAGAINAGFSIIRDHIKTYNIDCDFEEKQGFIYAEDDAQEKQLEDLYDGTVAVDVPIEYVEQVPIPVPFQRAVKLPGQAQFHPLKYLQGLLQQFATSGGSVIGDTKIETIKTDNGVHTAKSAGMGFRAKHIIYATHLPPGINVFSLRCAPYRSYVIAVTLATNSYPDALIYDMQEPYHYFRTHQIEGQKFLIVGGNDHKTGHDDPEKAFADLENYTRKYFDVSSVEYKWSSQYYVPVDGLPYVGQIPFYADGIYCATGYNGNGMMLGSISAQILSDLVLGKKHPYAKLFDTGRLKPVDGFTEFVKENADVAYHFVADRLSVEETDSLKNLPPGTGQVVKFDGKKVAAYRDDNGDIHALNPVCTHAACIVNWNAEEKSWDCPCHGARYDIQGRVLTGPAEKNLQKLDFD